MLRRYLLLKLGVLRHESQQVVFGLVKLFESQLLVPLQLRHLQLVQIQLLQLHRLLTQTLHAALLVGLFVGVVGPGGKRGAVVPAGDG